MCEKYQNHDIIFLNSNFKKIRVKVRMKARVKVNMESPQGEKAGNRKIEHTFIFFCTFFTDDGILQKERINNRL